MPVGFLKFRFVTYLQEFLHDSRSIGLLLLGCTVFSLILANTDAGPAVLHFLHWEATAMHALQLPHTPLHFINDGLMAVFFFLVGMEIKRELVIGELNTVRRAVLPLAAAAGGMIVPAAIYLLFNKGTEFQNGWGIPMATDIAFSLGVASLLGSKFPVSLKVFLTALAIIDDLGAIIVIALFYGGAVKGLYLLGAGLVLALLYWMNKRKMRFGIAHVLLGLLLWYLVFNCGIHATIAGVLFAFMVPTSQIPSLEMKLHNVVNFLILPLFAIANTAIVLNVSVMSELTNTLGLGIVAGLVLGKPIGIFLACWLLVRNRLASLPNGINWMQLAGAGLLAGIGFTMSIFIAGLAFDEMQYQDISKIAILVAALLSVLLTFIWFQVSHRLTVKQPPKPTPVF